MPPPSGPCHAVNPLAMTCAPPSLETFTYCHFPFATFGDDQNSRRSPDETLIPARCSTVSSPCCVCQCVIGPETSWPVASVTSKNVAATASPIPGGPPSESSTEL